jgi:hypothetical protein
MPVLQSETAPHPLLLSTKLIALSAFYRASPRRLLMEVVAFRDIEPGDEIYINCEYAQKLCPKSYRS